MRFDRLELIRWGALENTTLDFSSPSPGLQVVLGVNEAGKSTTRRAIAALLFGIPGQTTDNFRFDYKDLRIGAALRWADGTVEVFRRRKANKDSVVDLEDKPVQLARLSALRTQPGPERFGQEWSLDHEQLRNGGLELLAGKGRVGESLVSAGLGGIGVARLLEALDATAAKSFAPRASAPKVNGLLAKLAQLRAELRASIVDPRLVQENRKRLDDLGQRRSALDEARVTFRTELMTLDRLDAARPGLLERERLRAELAPLAGAPRVGDGFGNRRVAAQHDFAAANAAIALLDEEITKQKEEFGRLVLDSPALAEAAEIERLVARRESYEIDGRQLAILTQQIPEAEARLDGLARAQGITRAELEKLARSAYRALSTKVRRLADAATLVRSEASRLAAEHAQSVGELGRLDALIKGRGAPPDATALRLALKRLLDEGLENQLKKAEKKATALAKEADAAFEALPKWTQSRVRFEKARLPSDDELDEHAETLAARDELKDLAEKHAETHKEIVKIERQRDKQAASGPVPTEDSLRQSRAHRDGGWKLVRQTLEGPAPSPGVLRAFTKDKALPDAYELSVTEADEIADDLRSDSERIAKYEQVLERLVEAVAKRDELERDVSAASLRVQAAETAWAAVWASFELEPTSPEAMRKWLKKAEAVHAALELAREAKDEFGEVQKQARAIFEPLATLLGCPGAELSRLAEIRAKAELQVAAADSEKREHEAALKELVDARKRSEKLDASRREADENLKTWRHDWASLLSKEALAPDAEPPVIAALMDDVVAAAALLDTLTQLASDLKRTQAGRRSFDEDVAAVVARLGIESIGSGITGTVHGLQSRLDAARKVRDEAASYVALRKQSDANRIKAGEKQATAREDLGQLLTEAGTTDSARLVLIEADDAKRRQLEAELAACEKSLTTIAKGRPLELLEQDVAARSAEEVAVRRDRVSGELATSEEEQARVNQEIGAVDHELGQANGGDSAADKDAELQSTLVTLREETETFLRLRYAEGMLRAAVERFRAENQSPMLLRTSELFRRLTLDSFVGVDVRDDDDGSVIEGVRANARGAREYVRVDGMSDGTRDQLFLALRLAALEQEVTTQEPLPFVVDDILINLSDERALAALGVLAELGTKVQVLLFTHHSRIAELARGLGPSRAAVHELCAVRDLLAAAG